MIENDRRKKAETNAVTPASSDSGEKKKPQSLSEVSGPKIDRAAEAKKEAERKPITHDPRKGT